MHSKELDWMALSKLPPGDAENILSLAEILKDATVSPQMFAKLPKAYVSRLFLTMQTELLSFRANYPQIKEIEKSRVRERDDLVLRAAIMEEKLKASKGQLDEKKKNVDALQETLERMQVKLAKMEKPQKVVTVKSREQVFYCVYCKVGGFPSQEQFEIHMLSQHPPKESHNQTVKEIVLALKEKEMALMEMVLKKNDEVAQISRRMADQELSFKTRQFQTAQCFGTSIEDHTPREEELVSQTQFVWFQQENDQNRGNTHTHISTNVNRNQSLRNHFMSNRSEYTSSKSEFRLYTQKHHFNEQSKAPYTIQLIPSVQKLPSESHGIGVKLGLYTTQKEVLKTYKSSMDCENSLYQTKNISKISSGCHVYSSGPLESDDSDSEPADYFRVGGRNRQKVIDEEIQVPQHLLQRLQHCKSNKQLTINSVSSPKSGEKTLDPLLSQMLSIDDHDFSLSKDSNTINLSDLKFEKLATKKESDRQSQPPVQDFARESPQPFARKQFQLSKMGQENEALLAEFYSESAKDTFFELPLRKTSSYKPQNGFLLEEFITAGPRNQSVRRQSPRRQVEGQSSTAIRKLGKTEKLYKPHESLTSPTNRSERPIESSFHISSQSQIKITQPSPREITSPSEVPTERLILQDLIDLTLIREEDMEQSLLDLRLS